MGRKIGIFILILFTGSLLIYHQVILYGIRQGMGQWHVISNSVPVEEYLSRTDIPDSVRSKLDLISEVKEYAYSNFGINESENYETIFDQGGEAILWNVSASQPFKLEAYEWTFPFLGSFSYKGYFDYELAQKEYERLSALGLDTRVREVGGWSTLGWFKDPILSNMLNRSEGELAELIIHELTHGTLYVKDSVEFNENLASFIGKTGAVEFLTFKYGSESIELKDYLKSKADYEKYIAHMLLGTEKLDSLYARMDSETADFKKDKKTLLIREIINQLDTISYNEPSRFTWSEYPNNAYFMSVLRYQSKTDQFEVEFKSKFNQDLKSFLEYYKERYPSL